LINLLNLLMLEKTNLQKEIFEVMYTFLCNQKEKERERERERERYIRYDKMTYCFVRIVNMFVLMIIVVERSKN